MNSQWQEVTLEGLSIKSCFMKGAFLFACMHHTTAVAILTLYPLHEWDSVFASWEGPLGLEGPKEPHRLHFLVMWSPGDRKPETSTSPVTPPILPKITWLVGKGLNMASSGSTWSSTNCTKKNKLQIKINSAAVSLNWSHIWDLIFRKTEQFGEVKDFSNILGIYLCMTFVPSNDLHYKKVNFAFQV